MRIVIAVSAVLLLGACVGSTNPETAQAVQSVQPANGSTGVRTDSAITIGFSHPLDAASVPSAFSLAAAGVSVPGTLAVSGAQLVFTPDAELAANTQYDATVSTAVRFTTGQQIRTPFVSHFTTGAALDHTPPALVSTTPAKDATGVALTANVSATFSEPISLASVTQQTFTLTGPGTTPVAATTSIAGAIATLHPSSALSANTTYTATVTTGIKDQAENPLAERYSWSFTTGAGPDTTAPTVTAVTPADAATDVPVTVGAVTATFSEAMNPGTLTAASFQLKAGTSTTNLCATVALNGSVATCTLAGPLTVSTQYTASIKTTAKDLAGNAAVAKTWTFTTEATAFTVAHAVATSPTTVTLTFSQDANGAQASAPANYCIATGGACASPGDLAVSAATAAANAVTLTTAAQTSAATYTVFVSGVTRASDGAPLTAASVGFTGYVPQTFNVVSATAISATSVEVAYSDDVAANAQTAGNYCIADAAAADCSAPVLAVSAAASASARRIVLTTAAQSPIATYRLYVTGVTRLSNGDALTANKADFSGRSLLNASFEQETGATLTGWATSTTGTSPLTATAPGSSPTPHDGANVASFPSLTSSIGGREAHSNCFAIDASRTLTVSGWLRTAQAVSRTKASYKIYWWTDSACSAAASSPAATQSAFSLSAQDTWVQNTYSQMPPSNAKFAWIAIRPQFVSGTGASTDAVYFDDLSVTQP